MYLYFMVDMEILFVYVIFLCDLMLCKLCVEIYILFGLQKQGKNLFYCDFLYYLQYLLDKFIIVFGIWGLVMLVFMLFLYLYVFKVIKDYFLLFKEIMCELIKSKYQFVKCYDCVGCMVDMLEYFDVVFLFLCFDEDFIKELEKYVLLMVEYQCSDDGGEEIVICYVYIECCMILLNIWLYEGIDVQVEYGIIEYGNVIKEFIVVNIFFGDMLYKNFGVMCYGCVVFYDYDEIEYFIDCNICIVFQLWIEEEEMFGEVWYSVGLYDIFLEMYCMFLFGDLCVCEVFFKYYVDFFEVFMWQGYKECLFFGQMYDFYVYDVVECFVNCYGVSVFDNVV